MSSVYYALYIRIAEIRVVLTEIRARPTTPFLHPKDALHVTPRTDLHAHRRTRDSAGDKMNDRIDAIAFGPLKRYPNFTKKREARKTVNKRNVTRVVAGGNRFKLVLPARTAAVMMCIYAYNIIADSAFIFSLFYVHLVACIFLRSKCHVYKFIAGPL